MERKASIQSPETQKNKPKFSADGKRIIENWCSYAQYLIKKERLRAKKQTIVSKVTEKDKQVFEKAYKKLRQQQAKSEREKRRQIKRLVETRSATPCTKSHKQLKKSDDDNYVYCRIDYKAILKPSSPKASESKKKQVKTQENQMETLKTQDKTNGIVKGKGRPALRPIIKIPPLKLKAKKLKLSPPVPPKKKPRPVIVIPPIKTRPWVPPCMQPPKPRLKPVIEYPPLKMRKIPSKPKLQESKPKTPKITIPPVRLRPKKSCNQIRDPEFCESLKRVNWLMNQLERVQINKPNESGDNLHQKRSETEGEKLSTYPEFNLFTSTNDVRSIRGTEVKTIEMSQENVPMEICYAVATLCISRSLDPEFYTRDVINKIIVFGNDLIAQCSEACINDFNLCQQSICPDEINWNFELNSVFTNVQMEIFQRGIITTHPGPPPHLMHSLDEFFTFYSVGILVTHSFVVAIWRDNGEFFIFYSHPIDEVGKVCNESSSSQLVFPGLVVFKSVNDLYKNILGNIPELAYCKPFELRICNITMTDLCEEQKNDSYVEDAKSLLDVEWVLPAVAEPDNLLEIEMKSTKKEKKQTFKELMSKIKSKSSAAPGFIKFANGGLICGRISKQSKSLDLHYITREFHANAIGLAAVAMSSIKELNCWCGDVIDCVIKSGNNLYIESAVAQNTMKVPVKSLITSLIFDETQVNVTIEPFRDVTKENLELEFLSSTFDELFCCYSNGILSRGKECWALFNCCENFFLFDPLGIEVKGKKMYRRRAVLYKFESLDLMIEQLMTIFEDIFDDDCVETCEIFAILSCPTRFQQTLKKVPVSNEHPCPKKEFVKTRKSDNKIQDLMTLKHVEPICEIAEEKASDYVQIEDLCPS